MRRPGASSGSAAAGLLIAAAAAWVPAPAAAQPPDLVTDRPDQTESSDVVPVGAVQIEVGLSHTRDREAGFETELSELASTLVRIGLSERLELRLGWGGLIDEKVEFGGRELDASGAADLDLGVKVRLADEAGSRPAMAILAGTSLSVGAAEVSSGRSEPSFLFSASHTLSESVGLGYNLGPAWVSRTDVSGDRDLVVSWVYSLAVGRALGDKLGVFGEVFGRTGGSLESEASLDGGLTYLHRPNQQFDLFAGFGISGGAADWFVGLGYSIRLPE